MICFVFISICNFLDLFLIYIFNLMFCLLRYGYVSSLRTFKVGMTPLEFVSSLEVACICEEHLAWTCHFRLPYIRTCMIIYIYIYIYICIYSSTHFWNILVVSSSRYLHYFFSICIFYNWFCDHSLSLRFVSSCLKFEPRMSLND